jgi:hypothetical protein
MSIELMQEIQKITQVISSMEQLAYLCSYLIWGTCFFLLFKYFHLKFIRFFIAAEIMGLVSWIWINRISIGSFMIPTGQSSNQEIVVIALTDMFITVTPLILGLIGAINALIFLLNYTKKL